MHRQNDAINTNYMARHKIKKSESDREREREVREKAQRIKEKAAKEQWGIQGTRELGAADNGYGSRVGKHTTQAKKESQLPTRQSQLGPRVAGAVPNDCK